MDDTPIPGDEPTAGLTQVSVDPVDRSVLEVLSARLGARGPAFRRALVQTWRDEATHRLADLDRAADAGDAMGVAAVTHALKSGSAALGAAPLAALCDGIEVTLRAGHDRDLCADAAAVRAAVGSADRAFRELWPEDQLSDGSGG